MFRQLGITLISVFILISCKPVADSQTPSNPEITDCDRKIQLRTSVYEFINLDNSAMRHPFIRGWFNGDKEWEVILFDSLSIDNREIYLLSLKPSTTTYSDFPDNEVQCYIFIDKETELVYRYRFTISPFDKICIFDKNNPSEAFLFGVFSVIADLNAETLGEFTFDALVDWVDVNVCFPFSAQNLRWFGCNQSISNDRYDPEYDKELIGLSMWKDQDGSTNVEIRNPSKLFK